MNTRVLVVEDNKDLLELLSRTLQFFGFQVTGARNGVDAVAMALSERPAVILMDVVMPKMDGLEALSQIRANPQTREIPVLALTAWMSPTSREVYRARGFNDYLAKPFKQEALLTAIGQLLSDADKQSAASELIDRPN
ncbi:MAG TPA: response regulator [Terriglobales bacterium]|nr:response regulator [Terriglobales bacterium]